MTGLLLPEPSRSVNVAIAASGSVSNDSTSRLRRETETFPVSSRLTGPLSAIIRSGEAEADWSELEATHDPVAMRTLLHGLATTSLADPDPPAWSYVLNEDHPTIMQRIAMVEEWQARR